MMVKALYVHIPFCSYKCPYCDFTSVIRAPISPERYLNLVLREAELYRDVNRNIKTLYLGGGTPTLLKPSLIGKLLSDLDRVLNLSGVEEITVECNPETYRREDFRELLELGVNRLSIGAQSFTDKGLSALGRKHTKEDTLRAYQEAVEAGFENVNLDLIYAYPGQGERDMEEELVWIERLRPKHVSAYMLTPYSGTPLGVEILNGTIDTPSEDTLNSIYTRLWTGLKEIGYRRYELSNWAFDGFECRHNLSYWKREEFLGLGVSAWGFYSGVRYGNTKNLISYSKAVSEGKKPVESVVRVGKEDAMEEFIMLSLRLKEGLPHQFEDLIPDKLKVFFERGGKGIGIREEFMLLADEIITEVLLYNSHRKALEVRNG